MTAVTDAPAEATMRAARERDGLRADIQALRALAVGSVMLFHLWPHRLTGGYVGVDVFFVISGYLLTAHLLSEIEATGRVRPARFWARRAKRLVPASTLVLLATAAAVVALVPHYLWRQYFQEIVASTLQVQNWLLAHNSVDYLGAQNLPSPTQHFWTLSAEEQFYVILPLLLLTMTAVAGLLRVVRRWVIAATLVLVVGGSLAYSVWLTTTTPGVAYFSTFTRAWEFGIGSLVALGVVSGRRHRVLPWLGVVAIVAACVLYDSGTAFPGYAAALPVLGTAAVIVFGQHSVISRIGAFAPVAFLGRVSYPAYLWHWPLIVLTPYVTHRPLDAADKIAIFAATLVLSWLSTTFVEEPIRFRPRLLGARRPRIVAAWCGSAMAVVVALSFSMIQVQDRRDERAAEATKMLLAGEARCLGAQALDPRSAPCRNRALDGVLVPDPAAAKSDDDNLKECWGSQAGSGAKVCTVGPETGYRKRLYAIGDSHNNTLIGVYRRIANANKWRIDVSGNAGCYLTDARQTQAAERIERGCEGWRRSVIAHARTGNYDAFIVTHSTRDALVVPGEGESQEQATVRGLVAAWNKLPDAPIIAIRDNPAMTRDTISCVNRYLGNAAAHCARPRSVALAFDGQAEAARQVPRAHVIDLSDYYCGRDVCAPVVGHVLVYRDSGHITATYAATLAPYLNDAMVRVLTDSSPGSRTGR